MASLLLSIMAKYLTSSSGLISNNKDLYFKANIFYLSAIIVLLISKLVNFSISKMSISPTETVVSWELSSTVDFMIIFWEINPAHYIILHWSCFILIVDYKVSILKNSLQLWDAIWGLIDKAYRRIVVWTISCKDSSKGEIF
jgi:hypothetical protein